MDVTDRQALSQALARTHGGDRDGWERIEEYQRVLEYTAEHPNKGSTAVASALELPRSRIRPWMDDGARPDPVRTIQRAEDYGWLDLGWDEPPFPGLNVLVAWIYSGGSVSENFTPRFIVDDDRDTSRLRAAFDQLGIGYREFDRDGGRGRETEPTTAPRTLGRLLVALGAPQGSKGPETRLTLPSYLSEAPEQIRLDFARTYVQNRATERPDLPNQPVQMKEERSKHFRVELRAFIVNVVGSEDAVTGSSTTLRLSQRAAALLYDDPTATGARK